MIFLFGVFKVACSLATRSVQREHATKTEAPNSRRRYIFFIIQNKNKCAIGEA